MTQHIDLDALQAALNDHQGNTYFLRVELLQGLIARLKKAEAARDSILRDAFNNISKHIIPGELQGNGLDQTAQRNGLILASNIVSQMLAAPSDSVEGAKG